MTKLILCGNSEKSFLFQSYELFKQSPIVLFSLERGFLTGNSGTVEPSTLHHEQVISGEEMHTLITFIL